MPSRGIGKRSREYAGQNKICFNTILFELPSFSSAGINACCKNTHLPFMCTEHPQKSCLHNVNMRLSAEINRFHIHADQNCQPATCWQKLCFLLLPSVLITS